MSGSFARYHADIAGRKAAGRSEDEIFDVMVAAVVAAALRRHDAADGPGAAAG